MRPKKTVLLKFGLPTGIALAMLALASAPIGIAADPSLPTSRRVGIRESGSNSSDKSESRDDKSSPANQFLTAYNSMSLADWLKEKGMRAEATDLYTEALNLFLKVSADYPQWQPAVVAFRINYCREALGGVERKATPNGSGVEERQTPNAESKTKNEVYPPSAAPEATREPRTKNQSQETSNAANLSPLNFKLQQAALKERGRDYTGALAMYSALLEEFPQEPWALKGACRCCLRLGRMDKARALTMQALTLPLPDAELNLLAALVDCHYGRYQAALPLLRKSLTCPEAHVALGVALAATGNTKEAQEEMKRALSLNPKLGDAYYNLARLSLGQKPTDTTTHINYQLAIDTARVHYQNALRHGAAPDPELDKLLAE